ncbi:MAG: pyridoxal phosphate-dependent aminotransferase [Caldisericum sp.]|uniref:pyridoxal phosphate-dependent aminotransferase n=1 Tax=Caldisericum sp. TaxID=2499687 RepID=UPI003D0E6616
MSAESANFVVNYSRIFKIDFNIMLFLFCMVHVMPNLSTLTDMIQPSPIRKVLKIIADARAAGVDLIQFSAGQPSLPPDSEILEYVAEFMLKNPQRASEYTPTSGIYELRRMIADDLRRYGDLEVDPETEITVTDGGSEGILLAYMATLQQGDEIILFDPTYVSYPNAAIMVGAKPVYLPLYVEDGYQPNVDKLNELINPKTKAIMITSPDNPTGRIIDEKRMKAIVDLAVDHDLWLIVDDAYKHLIYEGQHVWVARLPGAWERTIVLNTFSKDPAMTGWRLGYAYGPKEAISAMIKFKQYTTLCSSTIAQIAAMKYLQPEVKERVLKKTLPLYKERRDAMYDAVRKFLPEAKTIKSPGAMYLFVDIRAYLKRLNMSDDQFAENLLNLGKVALIPGSGFGRNGAGHLRMTFVTENIERINKGVEIISNVIDKLERSLVVSTK